MSSDIGELSALAQGVIARCVSCQKVVEDSVQTTLAAVLATRVRRGDRAAGPHAIVKAENLVISLFRPADTCMRHEDRLLDRRSGALDELPARHRRVRCRLRLVIDSFSFDVGTKHVARAVTVNNAFEQPASRQRLFAFTFRSRRTGRR